MHNKNSYYQHLLEICGDDEVKKKEFIKEAYKVALDTREFEIEMYWKRANYFWLFSAAIFIAFFAAAKEKLIYIQALLSLLGFLFALGWYMVARGSKLWQENWEMHIRFLEEEIHGPLFKTFFLPNTKFWKLHKEYPFSVSKVNQILSLFTTIFWLLIFSYSFNIIIPNDCKYTINEKVLKIIILIILFLLIVIGTYVLFQYSKSFQAKDLNDKKINLKKFHKDSEKKKGDFFYYERNKQYSILNSESKKQNHNLLDCIIKFLKI